MPEIAIAEEECLSYSEFAERYLGAQEPVIIRSGIAHWPAVTLWSASYLKEVAAGSRFQVLSKSDYGESGSKRLGEAAEESDIADIVRMMEAEDAPDISYVRQATSWASNPRLLADIHDLECGRPHIKKENGNLWMGPSGTVAQLHWDPAHNLFAQIRGEKKWILIPPWESHMTYPNAFPLSAVARYRGVREMSPAFREKLECCAASEKSLDVMLQDMSGTELAALYEWLAEYNNCDVNVESPDPARTPLFSATTRYQGTVRSGDVIFVPQAWRHYVRSLSPSISMNWFFGRERHDDQMKKTILEHFVSAS